MYWNYLIDDFRLEKQLVGTKVLIVVIHGSIMVMPQLALIPEFFFSWLVSGMC